MAVKTLQFFCPSPFRLRILFETLIEACVTNSKIHNYTLYAILSHENTMQWNSQFQGASEHIPGFEGQQINAFSLELIPCH
jgi:hypothetical protein